MTNEVNSGSATKYTCCQCGENLALNRFFKSNSELYAGIGHLPTCKDCLVREYKRYRIEYQNAHRAMQRLCMMCDIYYDAALFDKCYDDDDTIVGNYIKRTNIRQYKGRTFDTTIHESGLYFTGEQSNDVPDEAGEGQETPIDPRLIEKWGAGLTQMDYDLLENHYRQIKSSNPKCDNNQELFIFDLCYTKMQQMKAIRENRVDDYNKMTELYRKTFSQAGLKTVQETSSNNEDCWGIWQARIAQYTPEEYYKNKKLYKDFDGIGDYMERFILRPLRNLMFGTQDRDPEFCVHDDTEENDDVDSDTEDTL